MSNAPQLRTSAWYGDYELSLPFPADWVVSEQRPSLPDPMSEQDIVDALHSPVGQPPIAVAARGASRPIVIVDDLTRPTPAARVLPALLHEFERAGIAAAQVTLILASGSHGLGPSGAIEKKVGAEAAASCRLVLHDDQGKVERIGRTSFGTPVLVTPEVLESDFVVGLGGVYPQHSTGFGGGSKLALGVLGRRSIMNLHYRHASAEGSYDVNNDFRRDLDEVARMVGLRTSISVHVDADRQPVRLVCGDHEQYYADAVAFSREMYAAEPPGDADVVLSNAYPMDVSLTFMRSKGIIPLRHAAPGASRVIICACPEGIGHHGLFPFMDLPMFQRPRHLARMLRVQPASFSRKAAARLARKLAGMLRSPDEGGPPPPERPDPGPGTSPIWIYAPGRAPGSLPANIPGMHALYSWPEVLERIALEQGGREGLRVMVYSCAPLQVLNADPPPAPARPGELEAIR